MLKKDGFVIVELPNASSHEHYDCQPGLRFEDFYFAQVYGNDLPVFITTDSILHLFHVVFDCSLKFLENQTFYPMILDVTQMLKRALEGMILRTGASGLELAGAWSSRKEVAIISRRF